MYQINKYFTKRGRNCFFFNISTNVKMLIKNYTNDFTQNIKNNFSVDIDIRKLIKIFFK